VAYDDPIADRVAAALERLPLQPGESLGAIRMFGGLCFTLNGKMLAGTAKGKLMVRIAQGDFERAQASGLATPMDFTGKPLKGFAYLTEPAYASDDDLLEWIEASARYVRENPTAKRPRTKRPA
jgi:TfoX/Sxy family transcriptional regulator of competence genes